MRWPLTPPVAHSITVIPSSVVVGICVETRCQSLNPPAPPTHVIRMKLPCQWSASTQVRVFFPKADQGISYKRSLHPGQRRSGGGPRAADPASVAASRFPWGGYGDPLSRGQCWATALWLFALVLYWRLQWRNVGPGRARVSGQTAGRRSSTGVVASDEVGDWAGQSWARALWIYARGL